MAIKDNEKKAIEMLKARWVAHKELSNILGCNDCMTRQWLVKITHNYLLVEDKPYQESLKGKNKGVGKGRGRKDTTIYKIMTSEELLNACEM
ncbi:MAG: hypothetical protein IKC11_02910 [Clostridia bacterium]|nr:hypothetical protein [Clostridia bacterium]